MDSRCNVPPAPRSKDQELPRICHCCMCLGQSFIMALLDWDNRYFSVQNWRIKKEDQRTVQSVFPVYFHVVVLVRSALFMPKANGVSNLVRYHMLEFTSTAIIDSNVLWPYTLPTSHQQL